MPHLPTTPASAPAATCTVRARATSIARYLGSRHYLARGVPTGHRWRRWIVGVAATRRASTIISSAPPFASTSASGATPALIVVQVDVGTSREKHEWGHAERPKIVRYVECAVWPGK